MQLLLLLSQPTSLIKNGNTTFFKDVAIDFISTEDCSCCNLFNMQLKFLLSCCDTNKYPDNYRIIFSRLISFYGVVGKF